MVLLFLSSYRELSRWVGISKRRCWQSWGQYTAAQTRVFEPTHSVISDVSLLRSFLHLRMQGCQGALEEATSVTSRGAQATLSQSLQCQALFQALYVNKSQHSP